MKLCRREKMNRDRTRTAREFLETKPEMDSLLRNIDIENISSKDVYDAAIKGDQLALEIFEYTGTILGEALANFATFSDPEAFVIFGGLAKSGDLLLVPQGAYWTISTVKPLI